MPRIELMVCHRMPHRSLYWRGRPLPVCARCTGIFLGYASIPLFLFLPVPPAWMGWGLLMNLPALVDGATQAAGWRESNNALRLLTGLLCGLGQVLVAAALGKWLGVTAYHHLFPAGAG